MIYLSWEMKSYQKMPKNQTGSLHHQPSESTVSFMFLILIFMLSIPSIGYFAQLVITLERFSRAGPGGRGREWATLGVHPLSWLLSNNWLEEVCSTLTTGTFSSRLLLSNQDKGCTPSVAHSLPLPLGPALLNLWTLLHAQAILYIDWYLFQGNLKGESVVGAILTSLTSIWPSLHSDKTGVKRRPDSPF